jgi:Holliday junction resolvase RusA-like endonuclease
VIHLVVPGRPRGKDRPRFNTQTGRTYTPPQTATAEERVRGEWRRAGSPWLDGPLEMRLVIVVARPGGHYRVGGALSAAGKRSPWPTRKPDLSNVLKLVEDALNGCAYRDDAQIVFATVARRWCAPGEMEHIVVTVSEAPGVALEEAA